MSLSSRSIIRMSRYPRRLLTNDLANDAMPKGRVRTCGNTAGLRGLSSKIHRYQSSGHATHRTHQISAEMLTNEPGRTPIGQFRHAPGVCRMKCATGFHQASPHPHGQTNCAAVHLNRER